MGLGHFADRLLAVSFLGVLPYFSFLLLTSLAAILGHRRAREVGDSEAAPGASRHRFLVVIPAHDEEDVIAPTVASAKAMRYPPALVEVLVLADNCSDLTAERARAAGARVIERRDSTRRSKGYALEFLIDQLHASGEFEALDAVVVVDADTTVHPDLLRVFARGLAAGQDWIQSYDCVGNADRSWRTRLMAYAFSLINGVTLLGQQALGISAGLRGNGMCLSTRGLGRVPWRTHGLTEDIEYSWSVRIAGGRIAFDRQAVVYAAMLSQGGGASANQRQRWEAGRSELKRKMLGPLLRSAHLGWKEKAASVIELTMPTMVSLCGVFLVLSLLALIRMPDIFAQQEILLASLIGLPLSIAFLALAIQFASPFLLSFLPWRFAVSLLHFPHYAIWKLLIALKARPRMWVRTTRESASRVPARSTVLGSLGLLLFRERPARVYENGKLT
jgi:cellulose synthase/poly-beta-1,6-N-acetylglucosamine synthase-like glycosyltransferase